MIFTLCVEGDILINKISSWNHQMKELYFCKWQSNFSNTYICSHTHYERSTRYDSKIEKKIKQTVKHGLPMFVHVRTIILYECRE